MSRAVVKMLVELRERVERLENRRADDGYWTTIQSVDAATASVTTAEGRKVPLWSMSSRLVIQPVAGDQCLVLRGVAVCGVRPFSAGEADGDVDMIRDVLRHDRSNGELSLMNGTQLVALAEWCDQNFQALVTTLESGANTAGAVEFATPFTPVSTAATKVKVA